MMDFRCCCCPCFKRNHESYDVSLPRISFVTANEMITILPASLNDVCNRSQYENVPDSADDQPVHTNHDYRTPTTCNLFMNITPARRSQPPPSPVGDFSDLYATVDKTKRAKNSLRTLPSARFLTSTSTTSPQPISIINSYSTERSSRSLPSYANILTDGTRSNHDRYPQYEEVITRESLANRDQRLESEKEEQLRPLSPISSVQTESSSTDSYAEILGNNSASDINYSNRRSESYFPLLNEDDDEDDDISNPYATIEEINNPE